MSPDDGCFGRLWNLKEMEPHKGKSALWACLEVIARPTGLTLCFLITADAIRLYVPRTKHFLSRQTAYPQTVSQKTRRKPKFFSPKLLCVRHRSQHWKRNSCVKNKKKQRNSCVLNGYCITSLSHRDNISILKVLASKIFLPWPPGC